MKSKIAMLVMVVMISFALDAQEINPTTNTLPFRLEMMGSQEKFLDYCVSKLPINQYVAVQFTSTKGVLEQIQVPSIGTTQFVSYAVFRNYFTSMGMFLRGELLKRTDIASDINFLASTSYSAPDGSISFTTTLVFTNLGNLSGITSSSFHNVTHRYARAVVPAKNLQRFTIQVDNPPYSYGWTNGVSGATKAFNPPLPEFTTYDYIVINEWYSVLGSKARFTGEVPGYINTWTQHGALLGPAQSQITNPSQLEVFLPKGSESQVQWSTNLLQSQWSNLTNLTWTLGTDHVTINVNSNLPKAFFRALTPQ